MFEVLGRRLLGLGVEGFGCGRPLFGFPWNPGGDC